jgi:hypothetical protein
MDFVCVILFLVFYYLRPQEWASVFSTLHFVWITMLFGLLSLFLRPQGFRPRDLFTTPHDWAVLAFWLWIVGASPSPYNTFKETANLYIFYLVISQTLYTVPRLNQFTGWWTFLISSIAALALLSTVGIDPLGSADLTNGIMKGRLSLNLSIFNNPNALGHSVIPAIPLIYYFCIYKRSIFLRSLGVALFALIGFCVFLTESKGAFVSGSITLLATLAFGRPKSIQITIVVFSLLFGSAILSLLPRMAELNKSKSDEAIQGRVMAFKHGYKVLTTTTYGVGYKGWRQSFLEGKYHFKRTKFDEKSLKRPMPIVYKAPHSSYVCLGAELGYIGFFLHFAVLYTCLRTLVTATTATPDEERVRRILFALVVTYMVSSWMVDFEYRPTFFMFAAATAALHRHLHRINEKRQAETQAAEDERLHPSPPLWQIPLLPSTSTPNNPPPPNPTALPQNLTSGIAFAWNRLGIIDFLLIFLMTEAGVRYWHYLIQRM